MNSWFFVSNWSQLSLSTSSLARVSNCRLRSRVPPPSLGQDCFGSESLVQRNLTWPGLVSASLMTVM